MDNYEQKLGIKSWAEADRPREKLLLQGRRQLTDAELIAILIGSGNKTETAVDLSKRILGFYQNDLAKIAKLSVKELSKFKGKEQIIVFCRSGNRSGHAKMILEQNGFKNVINGGTWQEVDEANNKL